ncbi:hypothetical protein [Bowdeniella massiliensis]|uniref:hypothetical protein n=1 Tax=Bowdeniella massiliensis TaxID=2932264 RepID=UPI002028DC73|nr:hypothetical protein [Bowdeniella massiliensis]
MESTTTILPHGDAASPQGAVEVRHTSPQRSGEVERLRYDYLINATGPKLRLDAVHAAAELDKVIATLKTGVRDLAEVIGALAQAHAALPVYLQGQGPPGLVVDPGIRRSNAAITGAVKFIGSSLNIMMMVIKGHDKP